MFSKILQFFFHKGATLHHIQNRKTVLLPHHYNFLITLVCSSFPSPVKIKENELLPMLLEELPYLHISPHALGQMWEQQRQQVDRLHALSSPRRSKLSSQVGLQLLKVTTKWIY